MAVVWRYWWEIGTKVIKCWQLKLQDVSFFFHIVTTINWLIFSLPLFSACWVFSCFRNPLNSDIDYIGYLACVHDHSYVGVYTQGLGILTASQHNIFDSEKVTSFSCASDGVRTLGQRTLSLTYQLSHPISPVAIVYFQCHESTCCLRGGAASVAFRWTRLTTLMSTCPYLSCTTSSLSTLIIETAWSTTLMSTWMLSGMVFDRTEKESCFCVVENLCGKLVVFHIAWLECCYSS